MSEKDKIYTMHDATLLKMSSTKNFSPSIFGQCSHFIYPEEKRKSFGINFRGRKIGTLAKQRLMLLFAMEAMFMVFCFTNNKFHFTDN